MHPKMTEPKASKSQLDKFREAAREFETDDSEERFEANVAKVAKTPKLSAEEIKTLVKQAKRAPFDEAVARAGRGAVSRPTKLLKQKQMKPKGR
jgi:hypothetical protein